MFIRKLLKHKIDLAASMDLRIAGLVPQTVTHNVTINNLLPRPFETDRLNSAIQFAAEKSGCSFEEMYRVRPDENPAKRLVGPAEFGDACAFSV